VLLHTPVNDLLFSQVVERGAHELLGQVELVGDVCIAKPTTNRSYGR